MWHSDRSPRCDKVEYTLPFHWTIKVLLSYCYILTLNPDGWLDLEHEGQCSSKCFVSIILNSIYSLGLVEIICMYVRENFLKFPNIRRELPIAGCWLLHFCSLLLPVWMFAIEIFFTSIIPLRIFISTLLPRVIGLVLGLIIRPRVGPLCLPEDRTFG